jgi:hypothetical protein
MDASMMTHAITNITIPISKIASRRRSLNSSESWVSTNRFQNSLACMALASRLGVRLETTRQALGGAALAERLALAARKRWTTCWAGATLGKRRINRTAPNRRST